MNKIPIAIFIVSCFFVFNAVLVADDDFPKWLQGKSDTTEYKKWSKLYEHVFKELESKLGISLANEQLARQRIINTVNKAAGHWKLHGNKEYKVRLPYLIIGEIDPMHYEFHLSDEVLRKYVINK